MRVKTVPEMCVSKLYLKYVSQNCTRNMRVGTVPEMCALKLYLKYVCVLVETVVEVCVCVCVETVLET